MKQRSKYNSKKCEYDGIKFDSKDEMEFYRYLLNEKVCGRIKNIIVHPSFELIPNYEYRGVKRRGITYTADFSVVTIGDVMIIYDVKGMETQQGNLRRKMFEYQYPEIILQWISRSIKHGNLNGWIDYDELKKIRAKNRKENKNDIFHTV